MTTELTDRQKIAEVLRGQVLSAKDISKAVRIKEKEVLAHLPHIARTVSNSRKDRSVRFIVEPSVCLSCGFTFKKRERLKTPSRCPVCKSEEITEARYGIKED